MLHPLVERRSYDMQAPRHPHSPFETQPSFTTPSASAPATSHTPARRTQNLEPRRLARPRDPISGRMPGNDPTASGPRIHAAHNIPTLDMHDLQGAPLVTATDHERAVEAETHALDGP